MALGALFVCTRRSQILVYLSTDATTRRREMVLPTAWNSWTLVDTICSDSRAQPSSGWKLPPLSHTWTTSRTRRQQARNAPPSGLASAAISTYAHSTHKQTDEHTRLYLSSHPPLLLLLLCLLCACLQTASERILPNLSTYLGAKAKKHAEEALQEMEEGKSRDEAVAAMAEHELKQALGHLEVVRNKSCSIASAA
jgi:hypothetical protein